MALRSLKVNQYARLISFNSTRSVSDKVTHTGQKFDEDDYRLSRFVDKEKLVNRNFAIDLINSVPPQKCKDRVVWCDGGDGPIGHPKDKPGNHTCGYCGLRFTKEDHH